MTDAAPFSGLEPGTELTPPPHPQLGEPDVVYTYVTASGAPTFAAVRFTTETGKDFRQGHPATNGSGWAWNLRGVEPVLYRLDELADHLSSGSPAPIYIVEGEKDCDRLRAYLAERGLAGVVTSSPMGAGKWRDSFTEFLRGARHVIVVVDNDEPGLKHGRHIGTELRAHVDRVELRRAALDHKGADLSDHLDAELGLEELLPLEGLVEETTLELAEGELLMSVDEFIALEVIPPPPLWGTEEHALLVEGGLAFFAGRPGTGKTTLVVDLLFHLAAGLPWPPVDPENAAARGIAPWPVARPLNIALIENEGPLAMFRDKVRRKREAFPHELLGYLGIQVWRWGAFSFADTDAFAKAAIELDEKNIDLVVGDPLGMLGVEGVGSPDETGRFVQRLRSLGLGTRRAFLLIHHFRQRAEQQDDELARLSGAWSQHLDSLITLAQGSAPNEVRLAFPKLRWARAELPKPMMLGKVYARSSFEALALEDDVTLLEPKIVGALEEARRSGTGYGPGWLTSTTLAKSIGKGRADVSKALENAQHLFELRAGTAAKDLGAKSNAKLWGLKAWAEEEEAEAELEAAGGALESELDFGDERIDDLT